MQATVTGKYFLEERFANFISAVFLRILPPLPQPKLVLDSATPEGCKAELIWVVIIFQDSLPAKDDHLSKK